MREIKPVQIGDKLVGPGQPLYFVAEEGINHNGSVAVSNELTDVAAEAGADAVKFQTRTIEVVYSPEELARPRGEIPAEMLVQAIRREILPLEAVTRLRNSNFENSTNGDLKRLLEFTNAEYEEVDRHCREKNVPWFTACWDVESLERIEQLFPQTPAIKIASSCNQDRRLLRRARDTNKPIILSTGMTRGGLDRIREILGFIGTENLILLHCKSIYSTGMETDEEILKKLNLLAIDTLRETFRVPVGFSSHDSGIMPAYAAAARGACMIEKHITLRRALWGSDQSWSINPENLSRLIRMLRELPLILGDGQVTFDPAEEAAEKKLRRVRWENSEKN